MSMIDWLEHWLQTDDTKLIYILVLISISNMLDFVIGWINAKFNKNIRFSSSKAIYGIAKKIVMFILLIVFIPFALLMPDMIAKPALFTLYIGYLMSEINSVLNHLKLTDDDKDTDMFFDFINKFIGGSKDESKRD